MATIKDLSDEELIKLSQNSAPENRKDISSISDEELLSLHANESEKKDPMDVYRKAIFKELSKTGSQAEAVSAGALKGLLGFGRGAGELEAKLVDLLAGTQFAGKAPKVELPEGMQGAMQEYPMQAAVGEFAGGAIPLMAIPEAAAGELKALGPAIEKLPQALQAAGRMGGRLAKGAGFGAAIAPFYQPDTPVSEAVVPGSLLGAAGAAVGPVAGALGRGALRTLGMGGGATEAEVKAAMKASKRLGVGVPLGETIKSPMMKTAQSSFLTALPFSGMAKEYVSAGEGLKSQLEGLLKDMSPTEGKEVGKTLQNALFKAKDSAESEKNRLYGKVDDLASKMKLKVSPSNYRTQAADHLEDITRFIKENEEFKDIFDPSVYSILSKAKDKKSLSFESAFDLDKRINAALQKADADRDYPTSSILRSLKGSINDDIDNAAEQSGNNELIDLWREAKQHFSENVAPLREKDISNILKKDADLDTIIPKFLKTGMYERPQLLGRLTKHLSNDEKAALAHQYLTKSERDIGGTETLSADKALNAYNKLGNKQKDLLFTKDQREKMDDILKVRNLMGMDLKQMISPKTGEKAAKVAAMLAPAGAFTVGGIPSALGLMAAGRLAKEALMSDAFKKLYLQSLKSRHLQTPELGRASYLGLPFTQDTQG